MSNEILVTHEASIMDAIGRANTIEDAKSVLKQISDIKAWLDLADKFREESIRYAQLEATALIVIVKKGMSKAIGNSNSKRRKAAEWLCSLSEEEQELYVGMCSDGLLIEQVWWREVGSVIDREERLSEAVELKDEAVEELKECGYVDITPYIEGIHRTLADHNVASDIVDGMRNKLRQTGGVGALHAHMYVIPEVGETDAIVDAIETRVSNIIKTGQSLYELCQIAKAKIDIDDLKNVNNTFVNANYMLFQWLEDIGAIDATNSYPTLPYEVKRSTMHYLDDRKKWCEEELADIEFKIRMRAQ